MRILFSEPAVFAAPLACNCRRRCNGLLRAGAYALSHNLNGGAASLIGSHARKWTNYVIVLFSGLVVVDVANALLLLTVGEAAEEEEAAAPAEAKAASGEEVEKVASVV